MPTGLLSTADQWYNAPPAQYYPGQQVAGMNPYQTGGINASIYGAGQAAGYAPQLMGAAGNMMSGLQGFAAGGGAQVGDQYTNMMSPSEINAIQGNFEVNPFIEGQADAFGSAAQRTLEQNILPSTMSDALGMGQMGSSRHGIAQGVATGNLGQSLQETLAGLYGNAWQNAAQNQLQSRGQTLSALGQERGRGTQAAMQNAQNQQNAWGMLPGAMNAYGNMAGVSAGLLGAPGAAMQAGGQTYQNNAQAQIDAARQRWDFYQNQPADRLNTYQGFLTGAPNMGQAPVPNTGNPMASGLYGAQTGLNMASLMGSSGGGGGGYVDPNLGMGSGYNPFSGMVPSS